MKNEEQQLIKNFLSLFSIAHAIPRINEALALKEIQFNSPVLDFGCGDGRFAKIVFKNLDVGLDPDQAELEKAKANRCYTKLVLARGEKMPFKDKEFQTVIANSVLEHVADLNDVLVEINRILGKGGLLILTVPNPRVSDYLLWSKVIPNYAEIKRRLWQHINYYGEDIWREKLSKAGFKIESIKATNSRNSIKWADIFFPFFWLGPTPYLSRLLTNLNVFGSDQQGATYVIIAKKQ